MSSAEVSRHVSEGAESSPDIIALRTAIEPAQRRVLDHPLYQELETIEDLITFTELHVYAVWDFMSLLKVLQRRFTCVEVPWTPTPSPLARRLINEIVLVEETDSFGLDYLSHFELYLGAMEDLGSDTGPIRRFVELLSENVPVPAALDQAGVPAPAAAFVRTTWDVVTTAPVHCVAAAFALTREDLIPEMFERVLDSDGVEPGRLDRFIDYLRRHIQVDAEEHTPMAMQLLLELCGDDERKWQECVAVAERCFNARAALWTGVSEALASSKRRPATEQICVRIDLPGTASASEVDVTVVDNVLTVRNRRTGQGCDLAVSSGLRPSDVDASFAFGTLELRLPAAGPAEPVRSQVVPVAEELPTRPPLRIQR